MADKTHDAFALLRDLDKKGPEWLEDHKRHVRVWFAGLTLEDQREIVWLLKKHSLVTYHALCAIAESRKPR